jgi:hypothetical protein
MARLRLIHWNVDEATPYIERLRAARHEVEFGGEYTTWKGNPVDAFVIDLSRLPSHGREVATALRGARATRGIPIVFVDRLPEKVDSIRALLPDATYTTWRQIKPALKTALAHPPAAPVVPAQMMDRYASRTVAQKLGIKENTPVLVLDPPRDYLRVLGDLPPGAWVEEELTAKAPVTLCFVREPEDLPSALETGRRLAAHSKLWICWPKGRKSGLREDDIRISAIALGLVDYKVCSLDATWSGLLFSLKRN